jgi:hypothetical protein
MNEEQKQKRYYEYVFGTKYPSKDMIVLALNRAHEIRQFEIRLYWQRSFFFWGFTLAFFTAFIFFFAEENDESIITALCLFAISILGMFTGYAWRCMAIGAKTWQGNWELHIDYLEDDITGRLHKTMLGKPNKFFSLSTILRDFISVIIIVWIILFILVLFQLAVALINIVIESHTLEKWLGGDCEPFIVIMLIFIFIFIFLVCLCLRKPCLQWLQKRWRTSKDTLPVADLNSPELKMTKRNLPYIKI